MMVCEEHKLTEGQRIYPGQRCPWCERDALLLQLREYQAALRKVDGCCDCLKNFPRFMTLGRGTPEPKCEDCTQEASNCQCIEKWKTDELSHEA